MKMRNKIQVMTILITFFVMIACVWVGFWADDFNQWYSRAMIVTAIIIFLFALILFISALFTRLESEDKQ